MSQSTEFSYQTCLDELAQTELLIREHAYCLPLYILLAQGYLQLKYPDLASGAAYKALLLSDAIQDEGDEFHDAAVYAIHAIFPQISSNKLSQIDRGGERGTCDDCLDADATSNVQALTTDLYLPIVYVEIDLAVDV